MKIKLFEQYIETYTSIEFTEFATNSPASTKRQITIPDNIINEIKDKLDLDFKRRKSGDGDRYLSGISHEDKQRSIVLFEAKDEWYYLGYTVYSKPVTNLYYKCDQVKGLIDCLGMLLELFKSNTS